MRSGTPPEERETMDEFEPLEEEVEAAQPGPSIKRTLARNTSANAIAQAIQLGSNFIFMPFLIKSFGLSMYGVYLFASSLGGYMSFLDFGVGLSLTKLLSEYRAKNDNEHSSRLVSSALAFYAGVGVLGCFLLLLIARYAVGWFHFTPDEQVVARNLLAAAAAFSPFMWPIVSVTSVQAGLNRYDINATAAMMGSALNAGVMLLVITLHLGPVALWVGLSLTTLVVSVWNWRRALIELGREVHIKLANIHPSALAPLVKMSAYIFVIQVSTTLIYQQTDRLIVGFFVGAAAVALYEAAAKVESLVRQIAGMMASAVVPVTSRLSALEDKEAVRRLLLRGTRYAAFVVLPITTGLTLLARPILVTWLGPSFGTSTVLAQLFLSYWLVNVNGAVMGSMIVGIGRLDRVIWWQNLGTFLNVALGVLLTWKFGVIGVILGTVLSHLIVLPAYLRIGYRLLGVRLGEWLHQVAVPAYPTLLVTVAVVGVGYALGLTSGLVGVAITGLASVFAYWLTVFLFLLDDVERRDVASLRDAFFGKVRSMLRTA